MPRRRTSSLADYVVTAFSPALIMLLVGSLAFYLLGVSYRGQFAERMHWILFWFVMAIVLVARIAIEQGREHALQYGLGLAAATSVVMLRLVGLEALPGLAILALIWWVTDRLTWDSTFLDEEADASGAGLLQAAGIERGATGQPPDAPPTAPTPQARPHAPGVWAFYCSLAALPMFGALQWFGSGDESARRWQQLYVLLYAGSALGLLLTTSFLGLRRYLRQRDVKMPRTVTLAWMVCGAALVAGLLLVARLLPHPAQAVSPARLMAETRRLIQEAAGRSPLDRGNRPDERAEPAQVKDQPQPGAAQQPQRGGNPAQEPGEPQPDPQGGPQPAPDDRQGDRPPQNADPQNAGNPAPGGEGPRPPNEAHGGQNAAPQKQPRPPQGQRSSPEPSRRSLSEGIRGLSAWQPWLERLFLLVLGVVVVVLLARHAGRWLAEWRAWWAGSPPRPSGASDSAAASSAPIPTLREFANPFSSGLADRWGPAQALKYTYQALQAWARDISIENPEKLTPFELAGALSERHPEIDRALRPTIQQIARLAYSEASPDPAGVFPLLRELWRQLDAQRDSLNPPHTRFG